MITITDSKRPKQSDADALLPESSNSTRTPCISFTGKPPLNVLTEAFLPPELTSVLDIHQKGLVKIPLPQDCLPFVGGRATSCSPRNRNTEAQNCAYCLANVAHPRLGRGESYVCGYKPYRCEICNYSTVTKGNLAIHEQSDKHLNNVQVRQRGPMSKDCYRAVDDQSALTVHGNMSYGIIVSFCHNVFVPKETLFAPSADYDHQQSLQYLKSLEESTTGVLTKFKNGKIAGATGLSLEKESKSPYITNQKMPGDPDVQGSTNSDLDLYAAFNSGPRFLPPVINSFKQQNGLQNNGRHVTKHSSQLLAATVPTKNAPTIQGESFLGLPGDSDLLHLPETMGQPLVCLICSSFCTDNPEALIEHAERSRIPLDLEATNRQVTTHADGMWHCRVCTYRSALKANFQLHCKTEKHAQRLSLLVHIWEGLSTANSSQDEPASGLCGQQLRCLACGFFSGSVHKFRVHCQMLSHVRFARLFSYITHKRDELRAALVAFTQVYVDHLKTMVPSLSVGQTAAADNASKQNAVSVVNSTAATAAVQNLLKMVAEVKIVYDCRSCLHAAPTEAAAENFSWFSVAEVLRHCHSEEHQVS
ncbi:unnamed protein product [Dibothriocephalus latus]|uniref:C2H2-type domain-containing protein n=1 Tax=Dibothriocephalus latus TaxID=60516 RepID=A0A3P6TXW5_DIBLA|nr:unnamed protein product [Dibothriocephalus latus]